jgi:hypothetical protein
MSPIAIVAMWLLTPHSTTVPFMELTVTELVVRVLCGRVDIDVWRQVQPARAFDEGAVPDGTVDVFRGGAPTGTIYPSSRCFPFADMTPRSNERQNGAIVGSDWRAPVVRCGRDAAILADRPGCRMARGVATDYLLSDSRGAAAHDPDPVRLAARAARFGAGADPRGRRIHRPRRWRFR